MAHNVAKYADGTVVSDKEVVDFIADLFQQPGRWIKHAAAKDAYGGTVSVKSSQACSFCLSGATERFAASSTQRERINKLIERFAPDNYSSIPGFNDAARTAQDHVVHVLKSVSLHLEHT